MEIPYLEYLGLSDKPFGLTPDTEFYYESETHKEALEHLRFFLGQREGIALIYGEVGSGKTILSRIFLNSLDKEKYNTALILNPIMEEEEFIKEILGELGAPWEESSKKTLLDTLGNFLIEEHRKGKDTILVIDEGQALSRKILELIRILSNIETEKAKIIHTAIFAQSEFIDTLEDPAMKNLSQRITVIYKLKHFSEKETNSYINFRLFKAGSKGTLQFSDEAEKIIFNTSEGCPRLINMICDRCLLVLYSRSKTVVDKEIVRSVINDESIIFLKKTRSSLPNRRRFLIPVVAVVVCLLVAAGIFLMYRGATLSGETAAQGLVKVKPLQSREAPVPSPVVFAATGTYCLICEKETGDIHLYRSDTSGLTAIKTIPSVIGRIHSNRRFYDDLSIPEGVFFFTRFIPRERLRPGYGFGAYVLNFPNLIDFRNDRKDGWIWLHGHDVHRGPGEDTARAKTGIAIGNNHLEEIHGLMGYNDFVFIVVKKMNYIEKTSRESIHKEIDSFLASWKNAWESVATDKLIEHYSPDFLGSRRENIAAFRQMKEKVNRIKRYIRVDIDNPSLFLYPDPKGTVAVVRFNQRYVSDNFHDESKKVLYIQKTDVDQEWKIIGEDIIGPYSGL